METETPGASTSRRPRTSLLVLFGIVLAVAAVMSLRDSTGPTLPTSNPSRPQQQAGAERIDPAQLDVNVERLKDTTPAPDDTERNPFRFRPKAPPPPPRTPREDRETPLPPPPGPVKPPQPPPIPLKFIGVVEAPGVGKVAALTDCRHTVQGKEGEEIDGRYRIVKIGVESVVIEYLDGKGRTTLRVTGQECVK
jgi:hypothetical protein